MTTFSSLQEGNDEDDEDDEEPDDDEEDEDGFNLVEPALNQAIMIVGEGEEFGNALAADVASVIDEPEPTHADIDSDGGMFR